MSIFEFNIHYVIFKSLIVSIQYSLLFHDRLRFRVTSENSKLMYPIISIIAFLIVSLKVVIYHVISYLGNS